MLLLACFPLWVKKVTRRFLKNNTSFSSKQHVVFLQMSACFSLSTLILETDYARSSYCYRILLIMSLL